MTQYKQILVPTDGSELSLDAIRGAADFAAPLAAQVVLVTVVEPYDFPSLNEYRSESIDDFDIRMKTEANEWLDRGEAILKAANVPCRRKIVKAYSPGEAIVQVAQEENCDCIFIASRGRSGIAAVILGSVTSKVLTLSPVPVMVYR